MAKFFFTRQNWSHSLTKGVFLFAPAIIRLRVEGSLRLVSQDAEWLRKMFSRQFPFF